MVTKAFSYDRFILFTCSMDSASASKLLRIHARRISSPAPSMSLAALSDTAPDFPNVLTKLSRVLLTSETCVSVMRARSPATRLLRSLRRIGLATGNGADSGRIPRDGDGAAMAPAQSTTALSQAAELPPSSEQPTKLKPVDCPSDEKALEAPWRPWEASLADDEQTARGLTFTSGSLPCSEKFGRIPCEYLGATDEGSSH